MNWYPSKNPLQSLIVWDWLRQQPAMGIKDSQWVIVGNVDGTWSMVLHQPAKVEYDDEGFNVLYWRGTFCEVICRAAIQQATVRREAKGE